MTRKPLQTLAVPGQPWDKKSGPTDAANILPGLTETRTLEVTRMAVDSLYTPFGVILNPNNSGTPGGVS